MTLWRFVFSIEIISFFIPVLSIPCFIGLPCFCCIGNQKLSNGNLSVTSDTERLMSYRWITNDPNAENMIDGRNVSKQNQLKV
jgi:hypothetical protein